MELFTHLCDYPDFLEIRRVIIAQSRVMNFSVRENLSAENGAKFSYLKGRRCGVSRMEPLLRIYIVGI